MILTRPRLNQLYTYPTLDRQTQDDGVRHYVDADGDALPSVTTILSATGDKTHLKLWEERVGAAAADRARKEGTDLGTLVHSHLEAFLEDRPRPRGNNLIRQLSERMADQIIHKGLPNVDEIWGIESMLYYPKLFAGTSDLIGVYQGKPAIMDFKNAKKMRTKDKIGDYMDQLAAYGMAHDILFNTNIDTGVIFMVSRDLKFETFVISGDEFAQHKASFALRLEKYLNWAGV